MEWKLKTKIWRGDQLPNKQICTFTHYMQDSLDQYPSMPIKFMALIRNASQCNVPLIYLFSSTLKATINTPHHYFSLRVKVMWPRLGQFIQSHGSWCHVNRCHYCCNKQSDEAGQAQANMLFGKFFSNVYDIEAWHDYSYISTWSHGGFTETPPRWHATIYIVMCQAHPALVKRVQWSVCLFQFLVVYY